MSVDEALLRAVAAGEQLPTLRLYAWQPACLSLGYGQRAREVDFERLAARGWEYVRRMTGGRAILHTDELTYSLTLPLDHPLAQQDVVESYRQISEALLAALRSLGAQPAADKLAEGAKSSDPVCFETPSHYEITVDGRKLIGSAQARKYGGLLQHGTLPLMGDIARICDVLVYEDEAVREAAKAHVRTRALTLADALGRSVSWEAVAETVAAAFRETFAVTLEQSALSAEEQRAAERITQNVYGSDDWTLRR